MSINPTTPTVSFDVSRLSLEMDSETSTASQLRAPMDTAMDGTESSEAAKAKQLVVVNTPEREVKKAKELTSGEVKFRNEVQFTFPLKSREDLRREFDRLPMHQFRTYDDLVTRVEKRVFGSEAYYKRMKSLTEGRFEAALTFGSKRNRYQEIAPNEATRYKISGDPDFYYNANTVCGGSIISCQGPMIMEGVDPIEDLRSFWKMVNHSKATAIVMVTDLISYEAMGPVEKCSKYWPEQGSETTFVSLGLTIKNIGERRVYTDSIDTSTSIMLRTFELTTKEGTRQLLQFHLQNWKDYGIVVKQALAQLVNLVVNHKMEIPAGPIVTHCSAGIGRSGTFNLVYDCYRDILLKAMKGSTILQNKAITLRSMDKGRDGSCENFEQYELANQTLNLLTTKR